MYYLVVKLISIGLTPHVPCIDGRQRTQIDALLGLVQTPLIRPLLDVVFSILYASSSMK